ncbi:phospholipase/carboxylesterase [Dunaliella salina]|uniref:Phospholipase/carboxylesterase n=1 Tax=Dunaliella salina TaxID=3046 RepID=A0ABQ7GFV4_DUNSA|nr:phospholipase/carboxylesterase [Dunaliella salina]|eukprot:KAF5833482.1 phospholipase/carboxylesterase [Dunaliella salina]
MGRHSTFLKRAQQLSCKHPFSQPPFSQHGMARFQVSFINAAIQQWKDLRARLAAALDPTLGDACLKSRPVSPNFLPPQPHGIAFRPDRDAKSLLHPLDVEPGGKRNGLLFIPSTYDHKQPSPMILMLHGSDASGMNCAHLFRWEELEEHRVIMLLPDARDACGRTWDVNVGGFGADVRFIDRALKRLFENFNIDPSKICCAGFSDGASYALSIGLPNGSEGPHGPFTHIMALSPGFMRLSSLSPVRPKVFISHGVNDKVLDINHCSGHIAYRLESMGFPPPDAHQGSFIFHEFLGGHCVPTEVASRALRWFLD